MSESQRLAAVPIHICYGFRGRKFCVDCDGWARPPIVVELWPCTPLATLGIAYQTLFRQDLTRALAGPKRRGRKGTR